MSRLFSTKFNNGAVHFSLLILRAGLGALMLTHGWGKLEHFSELSGQFSDPFHIGSTFSLALVVFAEVFCAALVILGLFARFATIPLIIQMGVIIFLIFGHESIGKRELPIHYMVGFLVILLCGPGKYSLDRLIGK